MRAARWLLVPLLAIPLGWVLFMGLGRDPAHIPSPLIGKPMPAFSGPSLDGPTLSSTTLAGAPMIVNFWASWCIPACVDEHPVLMEAAARYADEVQLVTRWLEEVAGHAELLRLAGRLASPAVGGAALQVRYDPGRHRHALPPGEARGRPERRGTPLGHRRRPAVAAAPGG